jgi:FtsZ-binding cell division protein ZapB
MKSLYKYSSSEIAQILELFKNIYSFKGLDKLGAIVRTCGPFGIQILFEYTDNGLVNEKILALFSEYQKLKIIRGTEEIFQKIDPLVVSHVDLERLQKNHDLLREKTQKLTPQSKSTHPTASIPRFFNFSGELDAKEITGSRIETEIGGLRAPCKNSDIFEKKGEKTNPPTEQMDRPVHPAIQYELILQNMRQIPLLRAEVEQLAARVQQLEAENRALRKENNELKIASKPIPVKVAEELVEEKEDRVLSMNGLC